MTTSGFESNIPINILPSTKNKPKALKDQVANQEITMQKQASTPPQSLVNTNSNIVLNQPTQVSPGLNQAALNATNTAQTNLNQAVKNNPNIPVQSTPSQLEFHGPRDIPAYAGIANMSFKSWIASQENKGYTNLDTLNKQLTATLDGIKGFQRQNYEGFEEDEPQQGKDNKELLQRIRNRNLILLSHIFSHIEQVSPQESELMVNISTFKKLGSSLGDDASASDEEYLEFKSPPPLPSELHKLNNIDFSKIKYLQQLLALPSEFPECLRLFARDNIEINPQELNSFLKQRLNLLQEQMFSPDQALSKTITSFLPLVNQDYYPVLLPLVLLYYPLPLPSVLEKLNLQEEWKKKKRESGTAPIIASCEIYYLSKIRGRFLLRFELNEKHEFSFDIQAAENNNGIVKDLEEAIAESMFLLAHPPLLSDLNVMLTKEIYKATDLDEELSIVSKGPLRLEIVLAVYASLVVLNKLSTEIDPAGIIDILE